MNLTEIQDLIKFVAKSGVSEVELQTETIKLVIKTNPKGNTNNSGNVQAIMQQPVAIPPIVVPAQPATTTSLPMAEEPKTTTTTTAKTDNKATEDTSKYHTIKSPMIGTFYRSPSPDKPPFVQVGDDIKEGSILCIIEAMKLFNEIESEVSGKIVKILVDDAKPVEYDQPLFLVELK